MNAMKQWSNLYLLHICEDNVKLWCAIVEPGVISIGQVPLIAPLSELMDILRYLEKLEFETTEHDAGWGVMVIYKKPGLWCNDLQIAEAFTGYMKQLTAQLMKKWRVN